MLPDLCSRQGSRPWPRQTEGLQRGLKRLTACEASSRYAIRREVELLFYCHQRSLLRRALRKVSGSLLQDLSWAGCVVLPALRI